MLCTWKEGAPYHLFYNSIKKSSHKPVDVITFDDILCHSLGKLKCSLQINYIIDITWLMQQYDSKLVSSLPLTIVYGFGDQQMKQYMNESLPQVTHHKVEMMDPFGAHNSKIGLYAYDGRSLRVVVSTANLCREDWNDFSQGIWISPECPRMSEHSVNRGESPTNFKRDLLYYLSSYKLLCLKPWIQRVERTDFSQIRVFLVTSIPGKHFSNDLGSHIYTVAKLLGKHCSLPAKTTPESEDALSWRIIAQSSSVGTLGRNANDWFQSLFLSSLAVHKASSLTGNPNTLISFVYPTVGNVKSGYSGSASGHCLYYKRSVREKQMWLQDYLHQWKADSTHKSKAMPRINSYTRVSPCHTKLAYYLLTSAILSKFVWGDNRQKNKSNQSVYISSYEVGVMFLPELFDEEYFEIVKTEANKDKNVFPFLYDLPLLAYRAEEEPWST